MLRRSLLPSAAILAVALLMPALPAAAADPTAFIQGLGGRLRFVATAVPADRRQAELSQLFRQDFDVPVITRFIFGRYWNLAAPDQQRELSAVLERYLISQYGDRLIEYGGSGQAPIILGSRAAEDGALVSSEIIFGHSPTQGGRGVPAAPIRVEWRLVASDGAYKISDVSIDGVSMAVTQRLALADEIARDGGQLSVLLATLQQRTYGEVH
jgi:phospholipid transport system substrate-binding protein